VCVIGLIGVTACQRSDDNAREADNLVETAPDQGPYRQFAENLDRYLSVHKQADREVPSLKETSDPAKVSGREQALGEAIRRLRADAKPGDIFAPEAAAAITKLIADDFKQRSPATQRAVLEEVPTEVPPKINDSYPTTMPLATVPPVLLMKLPTLPPELEYRFLGRHLILRDIKGNLIVDFIDNIVPA
jgi:hypothetical protein